MYTVPRTGHNVFHLCRFTNETDNLTIKNVTSEDEGLYVCRVNKDGAEEEVIRVAGCLIVHGIMLSYIHSLT